jgi:hypothetical protein
MSTRVVDRSVDPRVWRTALRLAHGDASRLRVDGPTAVVVLNPSVIHPRGTAS